MQKIFVRLIVYRGDEQWIQRTIEHSLKPGALVISSTNCITCTEISPSLILDLMDAEKLPPNIGIVHDGDLHRQFHYNPNSEPISEQKFDFYPRPG